MGLTHTTVKLRSLGFSNGTYEANFPVDTGATDSLVPGSELRSIGVQPVAKAHTSWRTPSRLNMNLGWLRSGSWVK
jgi:hypothetical protein